MGDGYRRLLYGPIAGAMCLLLVGCGGLRESTDAAAGHDCPGTTTVATKKPTSTDPVEAAHEYLGQEDAAVEGRDPDYSPWFGGAYAPEEDHSLVVVAVTDTCLVNVAELEKVVGAERLRLVEVPVGFDELNALRDELLEGFNAAGIPVSIPIDHTLNGRILHIHTPEADRVREVFPTGVPQGVVVITKGEPDSPA